jgi:hypothetical protein
LSLSGQFVQTPHLPQSPLVQMTRHPKGTAHGLFLNNLGAYDHSVEKLARQAEIRKREILCARRNFLGMGEGEGLASAALTRRN